MIASMAQWIILSCLLLMLRHTASVKFTQSALVDTFESFVRMSISQYGCYLRRISSKAANGRYYQLLIWTHNITTDLVYPILRGLLWVWIILRFGIWGSGSVLFHRFIHSIFLFFIIAILMTTAQPCFSHTSWSRIKRLCEIRYIVTICHSWEFCHTW